MHQTKISTKADKHGLSPAVSSSRLKQKTPATECLVCCVCVLYSMAKSVLRMVTVSVFVAITFYSFSLRAAKVPLGQYSRVSLLYVE